MGSTQTVSVSGVNIATYIDGEQGRPWIVLSNSLASDYSSSDDQLSLLTQNFRVLRYTRADTVAALCPKAPKRSSI
jgi:3-oxoadipate enol-lactonase